MAVDYSQVKANMPLWLSDKRANQKEEKNPHLGRFNHITSERRTPFQRDIDTITFDSAFRRLAHKTQVVLNPAKDFVRTRLTHSLEVARIGRQAARMFADLIWKNHTAEENEMKRCFEDAVAAACLVHDIGHPAFGHKGEKVLNKILESESDGNMFFEGNKQNFRLLTTKGFNLTYAVLDGIAKYKLCTKGAKSFGVYPEDAGAFQFVKEATGCIQCLSPITYLVEMADDISFCASDIEDALKQKWIDHGQVAKTLESSGLVGYYDGWDEIKGSQWQRVISDCLISDCYESLKTAVIKGLLMHSMHVLDNLPFEKLGSVDDLPSFLHSELKPKELNGLERLPILEHSSEIFEGAKFKPIKDAIYKNGLLKHHVSMESESQVTFILPKIWDYLSNNCPYRELQGLMPEKTCETLQKVKEESLEQKQLRLRATADYISGMTDRYALWFIDLVNGRVGSIR